MRNQLYKRFLLSMGLLLVWGIVLGAEESEQSTDEPIQPAEVKLGRPVDFEEDIYPILENNCISCHSSVIAENNLSLEELDDIFKGGKKGPAVVAKNPEKSLLYQFASRSVRPAMPPMPNKVEANVLTPRELGLLRQWIIEGAQAGSAVDVEQIQFGPLPAGLHPIYCVAVSPDGQYVACGRGNRIAVYHLLTGELAAELTDPALLTVQYDGKPLYRVGTSHRDFVHALAFNADGTVLASGGFRIVKLWRKPKNVTKLSIEAVAAVSAVAVSPDGRWLATGDVNNSVKLWDLSNGQAGPEMNGHGGQITSLQFSPDSAKLFSASLDKTIRVWNAADGTAIGQITGLAPINDITLTKEGDQVISADADHLIRLWPVPVDPTASVTEAAGELTGHEKPVTSVALVLPAGTQLLSGSQDGTLRVWNLADGKQVRVITHGGPVTDVAVRPDGQRFASAGSDNRAKLWNPADGKQLAEMKGDIQATRLVAKCTDDEFLAKGKLTAAKTASDAAEKKVAESEETFKKASAADDAAINASAQAAQKSKAAADAESLAQQKVADTQAQLQVEKKATSQVDQIVTAAAVTLKAANAAAAAAQDAAEKKPNDKTLTEAKGAVEKVAAAAKVVADKAAAAKADAEKSVAAATAALKTAQQQKDQAKKSAEDAAKAAQAAAESKLAAKKALAAAQSRVARAKEEVKLLKAQLQQAELAHRSAVAALNIANKEATEREKPIRSIAFSLDNRFLATAGDDHLVQTWDATTGAGLDTFGGHTGTVHAVAFTPTRTLMSGSADKSTKMWDLNPPWTLSGRLGVADDDPLNVAMSPFVSRVLALDFSGDDKLLATGGGDPSRSGELMIWDVAARTLVHNIAEAHSDTVFGVEFSRNGSHLVSGAADKFVKLFDVATGKWVRSFEGHTHHVLDVSWRADGQVIASAGADAAIKVWDANTGEQQRTISGYSKQVTSIRFIGRGDDMISCSGDKTVRFHHAHDGKNFRSFSGGTDFMYSASATEDEKLVIAGGEDGVLRVWNGADGKVVYVLKPPKPLDENTRASK